MKRMLMAVAVLAMVAGPVAMVRAAAAEPEAVQLMRIDLRKAQLEADAAPKMTQARTAKWRELQKNAGGVINKELADAEVDLVEAQALELTTGLNVKIVDTQLKEAIKGAAQIPARQAASPAEISVLQMEWQKVKVQSDTAVRVSDNRKRLLAQLQADPAAKNPVAIADAQADAVAAETNAALLALEVEAAQVRLDSAARATGAPGK